MTAAGGKGPVEALVFEVAGRRYALAAGCVRGLHRMVAVAPLPGAGVEGVANVRGELVPVFDLRGRLGLPPRAATPDDHLVVAAAGDRVVAVRVDRALDLVTLGAAAGPSAPGVRSVAGPDGGTLLFIHDLAAFLGPTALVPALAGGVP